MNMETQRELPYPTSFLSNPASFHTQGTTHTVNTQLAHPDCPHSPLAAISWPFLEPQGMHTVDTVHPQGNESGGENHTSFVTIQMWSCAPRICSVEKYRDSRCTFLQPCSPRGVRHGQKRGRLGTGTGALILWFNSHPKGWQSKLGCTFKKCFLTLTIALLVKMKWPAWHGSTHIQSQHEFEASMGYLISSRPAQVTQCD